MLKQKTYTSRRITIKKPCFCPIKINRNEKNIDLNLEGKTDNGYRVS